MTSLSGCLFLGDSIPNPVPVDVSVVIPCFNSSGTLGPTLESVVMQTLRPTRVIVVDDCSSDSESVAHEFLVGRYRDFCQVDYIRLPSNGGPATARNIGWGMSRTKWVAFCDSDDIWLPEKLERQMSRNLEGVDLVACGTISDRHAATRLSSPLGSQNATDRIGRIRILLRSQFSTSSVVLRRDIPFRFTTGRRFSEDWELWLKVILSGGVAIKLADQLVAGPSRSGDHGGLSSQLENMIRGAFVSAISIRRAGLMTLPELALTLSSMALRVPVRVVRVMSYRIFRNCRVSGMSACC